MGRKLPFVMKTKGDVALPTSAPGQSSTQTSQHCHFNERQHQKLAILQAFFLPERFFEFVCQVDVVICCITQYIHVELHGAMVRPLRMAQRYGPTHAHICVPLGPGFSAVQTSITHREHRIIELLTCSRWRPEGESE